MTETTINRDLTLKELILIAIDWTKYFLKYWKLLVVLGLLGGGIGYALAYYSKPMYTAELTLALEDKGTGSAYSGIASQFGIDLGNNGGGAFSGENNIELMRSRRLIEKTLLTEVDIDGKKQLLINRFLESNLMYKNIEDDPKILSQLEFTTENIKLPFGYKRDSVIRTIYNSIKTNSLLVSKIDKKLAIISVKFKSRDELFAKYFTEELVKNTSDFYIQTKVKKFKANVVILENRLDSVRTELNNEIYGAAISRDQNMNVIRAQGGVQATRRSLNLQVLTAMYGELVKNLEFAKYALLREEPLVQIIDYPILPLEKEKLGKLFSLILGGIIGGVLGMASLAFIRLKNQMFP